MRDVAESRERLRMLGLNPKPAWAEVWHLWNVILPRRSITGRLLTGQVWGRMMVFGGSLQEEVDLQGEASS